MSAFGFAMAALFVLSAAVQWNDPDPVVWIAAYLVPAALCAGASLGRVPRAWLVVGFVLYAAVASWWLPSILEMSSSTFSTIGMESRADEEAREGLGLWICAVALGVLALRIERRRTDQSASTSTGKRSK